jgi:hypothetical protein
MSITIGKNISRRQRRYLDISKHISPPESINILIDTIKNLNQDEELHPDWRDFYKQMPKKYVSDEFKEYLAKIFSPIDPEIATIDPQDVRLTFLLGAGASKPAPSDIPTVKELLPDLLRRAERLNRADLQKLADFCRDSGIENIEDLLTAAQLSEFCSKNSAVLNLVGFLIYGRDRDTSLGRSRAACQWRSKSVQ